MTKVQIGVLAGLLLVGQGCLRIFRPGEYERRQRCAKTLPVLREEPSRPYRIIKVYEESDEDELVEEACEEHADAVLSYGPSNGYTVSGGATVIGNTVVGRSRVKESDAVRGAAIRYTDGN